MADEQHGEGMSPEAIEAKMAEIRGVNGIIACSSCGRRFEPRIETYYAHFIELGAYTFCSDPPHAAYEETDGVWRLRAERVAPATLRPDTPSGQEPDPA